MPDKKIGVDSALTISGLQGAKAAFPGLVQRTDAQQIDLSCANAGDFTDVSCAGDITSVSKALFNDTKGTLVFFPKDTWTANSTKTFCFDLLNPDMGMKAPTIYIESGGAEASRPDAMWTTTAIKKVHVDMSKKCFPGSASDTPTILMDYPAAGFGCNASDPNANCTKSTPLFTVSMTQRGNMEPVTELGTLGYPTNGLGGCSAGKLRFETTGIRRLDLLNRGCGCLSYSPGKGKLVVGEEEDKGAVKFLAEFSVGYACNKDNGTIYDTIENCTSACQGSVFDSDLGSDKQGDLYTCQGRIKTDSIVILNPGWGYKTTPTIRIAKESQQKFQCSGTEFKAYLNRGAGLIARTNVVFVGLNCTGKSFSTLKACADDCKANCTGIPVWEKNQTTADGPIVEGMVYENRGSAYITNDAFPDVVSMHTEQDTAACTWGIANSSAPGPISANMQPTGPLSSWIKLGSDASFKQIEAIVLPTDAAADNCTTKPQDWNNFVGPITLKVNYTTKKEAEQQDCNTFLGVEMAAPPLFTTDFKSYYGWSQFGDSAPLKVKLKLLFVTGKLLLFGPYDTWYCLCPAGFPLYIYLDTHIRIHLYVCSTCMHTCSICWA
jgi:hypothetical protein